MKPQQSRSYPIVIGDADIPVGKITITVKLDNHMMPYLATHGITGEVALNFMNKLLDEARDAIDGSVQGVIVSNLEE